MSVFLDGRVMHEMTAEFWPTADADPASTPPMVEFARIWRDMPKFVFSKTLEHADWNATIVREVVPDEIRRLEAEPGGDMAVGGAVLAGEFMRHEARRDAPLRQRRRAPPLRRSFGLTAGSNTRGRRSARRSRTPSDTDAMASRWSLWSDDSLLSIGSKGSLLSIGSVGSVLSIGSVGSALSALSIGSVFSIGSIMSSASRWSMMSHRARTRVMDSQGVRPRNATS